MNFLVIQLDKSNPQEPFQAMYAALGYAAQVGKFTIAVDADIDPNDLSSVIWAMTTRTQPNRDITIMKNRKGSLDPSSAVQRHRSGRLTPEDLPVNIDHPADSAVIIDATMDWDYPPTSLPSKEYMEQALALWDELELPALDLMDPWYGQSHGDWSETLQEAAERAVNGEYMDYSFEALLEGQEQDTPGNREGM